MNVDSLNIQIKSSATDARNSVNDLIGSLKRLNKQLGLKEGARFVTTIKNMSSAIESLTKNVKGMETTRAQGQLTMRKTKARRIHSVQSS